MTVLISVMSDSLAGESAERSSGQHKVANTSGRNMKLPSQASTAARAHRGQQPTQRHGFRREIQVAAPEWSDELAAFASSITLTDDARCSIADTFEERCWALRPASTTGACQASPTGRGKNQEAFDMKSCFFALTCLAIATIGALRQGTVNRHVRGRPGRDALPRHAPVSCSGPIPTTEIQTREQKVYQPQVTTEYQAYQQTYLTPVTQYQWEPHLRHPLGILGTPYWTHELRPVTRWEARPATVQVPVAKTNWVETTHTTQVPVTTYRPAPRRIRYRSGGRSLRFEPGSCESNATSVASRTPVGGQQYQGDPPRAQSPWATAPSGSAYR